MGNRIDVDVDVLNSVAQNLLNDSADINDIAQRLERVEEKIREAWDSRYTERFIDIIEDVRRSITNTSRSIEEVSSSTENAALEIERQEAAIRNAIEANHSSVGGGNGSFGSGRGGGLR